MKRSKGASKHVNAPDLPKRHRKGSDSSYPLAGSSQAVPHQIKITERAELRTQAAKNRAHLDAHLSQSQRDMFGDLRQDSSAGLDDDSLPAVESVSDHMSFGDVADAVMDAVYNQPYHRNQGTWRSRTESAHASWENHLDPLTDSYVAWKSIPPPQTPQPHQTQEPPVTSPAPIEFDIVIIDMYSLESTLHVSLPDNESLAPHLMCRGYLVTTPTDASTAISIRTLEFYKHLRQRKASFSIEAFTKVLCDLYGTPFKRRWTKGLADAFEVFLSICRKLDKRMSIALERDSENWRVLNACPACTYELEDEPPLLYRLLFAMDGNDSMKRVKDKGVAGDSREFSSDYWIPLNEANQWALKSNDGPTTLGPAAADEWEDIHGVDDLGLATAGLDSNDKIKECVKNWKAAQSDSQKKAMGIFDETGWFAAACRHGIILWVTDMVQSGELSKYPLSIVNRALNILGGGMVGAYDIGCTFDVSIGNSPLGPRFRDSGSRCCVNAYHGYAHNFKCQTQNHPNNIPGLGIEDFETMERFFSGSNTAAGLVRNATKYRRRMYIELYMKQADADKYLQLGNMLLGNYKQACEIIEDEGGLLQETLESEGISENDLDKWQVEQKEYFVRDLGVETEENIHRVAYVELLMESNEARESVQKKSSAFLNAAPDDYDITQSAPKTYQAADSETRRLETARRQAREKVQDLNIELDEMELKLGIDKRWDAVTPGYIETLKYIKERRYHQALNSLQKVVVQRLFELHRLNISRIGYKARTLLAKAMRTRSRAVQAAVNRYNQAVLSLGRTDTLDFAIAAKYSFVEEFELLRNTRADLTATRWKEPVVREAMKRHQRIKRAHEEIERLNIETARVYSSIQNEFSHFSDTLSRLAESSDPLHPVLEDFCERRMQINLTILSRLRQVSRLPGYTGQPLQYRSRKGGGGESGTQGDQRREVPETSDLNEPAELDTNDDEEEAQIGGIVDFISDLATT